MMPPNNLPAGEEAPERNPSSYAVTASIVGSLLARVNTATPVRVVAVRPGAGGLVAGTVDVQPLVSQADEAGRTEPHGIVHGLPYLRLQGGGNAVILDPVAGDIGLAVFASRDISAVRSTRGPAPPGSRRRFSMSDGFYVGGFLNGEPTQTVAFTDQGIHLKSPTAVIVEAPRLDVQGAITATGNITAGMGTAGFVTLLQHRHPPDNTPPSPGS